MGREFLKSKRRIRWRNGNHKVQTNQIDYFILMKKQVELLVTPFVLTKGSVSIRKIIF